MNSPLKYSRPAPRSETRARAKKTTTYTSSSAHEARGFGWFQHVTRFRRVVVRCSPEGDGKETAVPDELFSESSGSSSASDAATARWYEAFETRVAASFRKSRRLSCGSAPWKSRLVTVFTRWSECSSPSEAKSRKRRPRYWRQGRWPQARSCSQANDRPMPKGRPVPG